MTQDEERIRELLGNWRSASMVGDLDAVLALMTDDVAFLVAGRPPMHKVEFAALFRRPAGAARPTIDSHADSREVCVCGDPAYLGSELKVAVTPPGMTGPVRRAGHTLTACKRGAGRRLLGCDADLLQVQP